MLTCTIDDSKAFANAVGLAARRVMATPQQPVLGGLLLEIHDLVGLLTVTGFDGDSSSTVSTPVFVGSKAGRLVVSGLKLAQLAKSLPAKPVTLQELPTMLRMTCGSVAIELPLMPVEDFPKLPDTAEPAGTVDAMELRAAIDRVISACDLKGETAKPANTGVYVALTQDEMQFTTTNGYRVAFASAPWRSVLETAWERALIPGRIVQDVASALTGLGPVRIGLTGTVCSFDGLGVTTVTRLLDAKSFPGRPKAEFMVRVDSPTVVQAAPLRDALKRAELVNDPKVQHVTLAFDGDTVVVSATGGKVDTAVPCEHPGKPITITVNSGYLGDAIVACDSALVELTIGATNRLPLLVTTAGVDGFGHLIMPIRK